MIYKLRDILKIRYGKNQKNVQDKNGKIPIIGTGGIIGYANTFLYNKPSVLIGRKGTIDNVKYIDSPFWTIDTLFYTEINEDIILPQYLFYKLSTLDLKNYDEGTTIPSLRTETLYEIEIDIDTLDIQKKVIKVLSNIDNKIKLNNQTNDNLYEILKKLYNELYLKNCSNEQWEYITLDETTSKFATGLNPRKNFVLGEGNNYYVTIKNMQNNQIILDNKCDYIDDEAILKINKRSNLQKGDLLFSGIGTIGKVYLIDETPTNWNISESVFTMRPNELISSEFLYLLLLSSDMQNYSISLASGSVQKGIRMTDLKKYKYKLPTIEFMTEFTDIVRPIIKKIYLNNKETNSLLQLRYTLLPKLMNGEIDLDKIEI